MEVDIPSGMIETEIDNMTKEVEQRLMYQGLNLNQYLEMIGKTKEEFRKEYEEQANTSVKNRLIIEEIIKKEKIEPQEEAINNKIKEMAEAYGRKEEELKENENFVKYIEETIKTEDAIKLIIDNAKIK